MAQVKCTECGQMFEDRLDSCPTCGCPNEQQCDEQETVNTECGTLHETFNEHQPYSPFSSNSWILRDPWPLKNYPIGRLEKNHPFLGWLFGPWHLTCKNKQEQEEYAVINNFFYLCNLIFKIQGYALLWNLCKMHILLLLWIIPIVNIFCAIMYFVAIGKALHRYWPQLRRVHIKLWRRFINSILNKENK